MKSQFGRFLKGCLWVTIVLFIVRMLISIKGISEFTLYTYLSYAGEAIGATTIIMTIYERILWRFNPFCKVPKLSKDYIGELKSSYDSQERNISVKFKQSLLSVHVTLISGESISKSITASIEEVLGEKQLIYTFLNNPYAEYRMKSEIHYGTAMLCVDDTNDIRGQYFTDRRTTGDIQLTAIMSNTK